MNTAGWRVPINVKLLVILAVPVLGYAGIATTAVVRAQQAANEISDQASLVETAVGPISLTTSLIDERTITGLEKAGLQDDLTLRIGSSTEARAATDQQLAELQNLLADNREAQAAYEPAVNQVAAELDALRADVDAGRLDDTTLFARHDEFINNLMDANASAVERVDDAEFWQGAMLSELATRQKNSRAELINVLIPVSLNDGGEATEQQLVRIGQALGDYDNRDHAIQELATGPYARAGSILFEATAAADLAELARNTLASGRLDSAELFDVASYKGGFVYEVPTGDFMHDNFRASVVEILSQDAAERTDAAAGALRLHLLAGAVGLVVTAGIAWVVSRSITRPLRALTEQAIDAATNRLPESIQAIHQTPLGEDLVWPEMEPISVRSSDEIADVADALNTMQRNALDLAAEEVMLRRLITDSLVTLGQRNQTLLDRQLDFITDLERDETDPDTLGDLFYLDHLAVRMRRYAESLLVLAGIDPPRTWLGPTAVGDIIRAALGEAEEYKHVKVREVEPATLTGSVTAELSHLLAELIENALKFSSAGKTVEVNGHRHPSSGDLPGDGYTLTVKDAGVGMSAEEIAQANRRLAGEEPYTVAPSKFMGHYVAGKLAARHGITVELSSNFPVKGITATIEIPARLLTSEAPTKPQTQLPPLPIVEVRGDWNEPTEATATPDLRLLDFSASEPDRTSDDDAPRHAASSSSKQAKPAKPTKAAKAAKPAKKAKKRPIAASKLPVPPPASEPLAIEPLEAPPDAGQAS